MRKTQADFSKTQCFGKFLVLLCSNCDVTLINFTKTEGFYQKLKEISLKHEEFSQKLKDFPKKLKEFSRKLNFTEKKGAWVARTSAKRQACYTRLFLCVFEKLKVKKLKVKKLKLRKNFYVMFFRLKNSSSRRFLDHFF